jgi:hypothetical protein
MDASMAAAAAAHGADEAAVRRAARSVPIAPEIIQVGWCSDCDVCLRCVQLSGKGWTSFTADECEQPPVGLQMEGLRGERPFGIAQAVKAAATAGARQIIVSDANTVFIAELLAAHGLRVGLLDPIQQPPPHCLCHADDHPKPPPRCTSDHEHGVFNPYKTYITAGRRCRTASLRCTPIRQPLRAACCA